MSFLSKIQAHYRVLAGVWSWPESSEEVRNVIELLKQLKISPTNKSLYEKLFKLVGGDHFSDLYDTHGATKTYFDKMTAYMLEVIDSNSYTSTESMGRSERHYQGNDGSLRSFLTSKN